MKSKSQKKAPEIVFRGGETSSSHPGYRGIQRNAGAFGRHGRLENAGGDEKAAAQIQEIGDILVILPGRVCNAIEEKVFDAAYDIELKHSVIFGIVVYGKEFWGSEVAASMPLTRILREKASLYERRAAPLKAEEGARNAGRCCLALSLREIVSNVEPDLLCLVL